jgi:hypothetical protein
VPTPFQPILSREFATVWRRHRLDLLAMLILFVCASIMSGRVWRFPFDDETFSIAPRIPPESRGSAVGLLLFYLNGGDILPPLSFLYYHFLNKAGFSEAAMRLCSLAMTGLALALTQWLTLAMLGRRRRASAPPATRLAAVLLFGLSPLAIGQGDAIRWHPQFAFLVALFMTLYLAAGKPTTRLASAVPLGLAVSVNLIAAIVVIPLLAYRYLLERQWRLPFDIVYWLVVVMFGSLGLDTAYALVTRKFAAIWSGAFDGAWLRAVATDLLGVFGGTAVGIGQAWIVVPAVLITAAAMVSEIDRRNPANPVHLFLLMFGMILPVALFGFAKPRSFLYLAPVLAGLLTMALDRQLDAGKAGRAILLASLTLVASAAAIANVSRGMHPFKRESVIPFEEVLDFIHANERGNALIVSTDPVVLWELTRQGDDPKRCLSYFVDEAACVAADRHYDSVFIVSGQSSRSRNLAFITRFEAQLADLVAGRSRVAAARFGVDQDQAIKSRLTGAVLDRFILTVELYR